MMYEWIIRPILFKVFSKDPEKAHEMALILLKLVGKQKWLTGLIKLYLNYDNSDEDEDVDLRQEIFGLRFQNPIGLAAGFDKNAIALQGLEALGFGFVEAGTVTRFKQEGNPRPRIFRFPKDGAVINRMGFPNDGADKIATRLRRAERIKIPLGISLGKSKNTLLGQAMTDYLYSFFALYFYGDYFVVNISSPNTAGLRELQEDKERLKFIILNLQTANKYFAEKNHLPLKPILIKIAPDLSWKAIDELLLVCFDCAVDGLIAVNITKEGMSGRPLWPKAISTVRYIHYVSEGRIPIIGVGGIFSAEEAYEMLKYAHLVQIYTGLVYKGPLLVHQINKGLKLLMERDGIKNLSELRQRGE